MGLRHRIKNYEDAVQIDLTNNNTLWQDATHAEMKTAWVPNTTCGIQKIQCYLIYDVKLGENFHHKARYCANGSTTDTPSSLTYSSIVACNSVQIALTVATLNKVLGRYP